MILLRLTSRYLTERARDAMFASRIILTFVASGSGVPDVAVASEGIPEIRAEAVKAATTLEALNHPGAPRGSWDGARSAGWRNILAVI